MPKVRFEPDGIEIEVPVGTSILEAAKKAHAQVGSACGGVCACSTCHVYVKEGARRPVGASDREEDILDKAFDVQPTSRLGCQSKIESEDAHRRRDQPREPPGVPRRASRDPRGAEGGGRRLALTPWRGSTSCCRATSAGRARAAREVIADGRVAIAGAPVADPRTEVDASQPLAAIVDDEPVQLFDVARVLLNKPIGCVTALRDARHPTAYALLRDAPLHAELRPVGRLDADTSGLLLWTTDGAEIQRLTHPKRAVPRTYQAALARPHRPLPAHLALDDGHRPGVTEFDGARARRRAPEPRHPGGRIRPCVDHDHRRRLPRGPADLRRARQPRPGPVPRSLRRHQPAPRPGPGQLSSPFLTVSGSQR